VLVILGEDAPPLPPWPFLDVVRLPCVAISRVALFVFRYITFTVRKCWSFYKTRFSFLVYLSTTLVSPFSLFFHYCRGNSLIACTNRNSSTHTTHAKDHRSSPLNSPIRPARSKPHGFTFSSSSSAYLVIPLLLFVNGSLLYILRYNIIILLLWSLMSLILLLIIISYFFSLVTDLLQ